VRQHGAILVTGVGQRSGLHLARQFRLRGVPVVGTYRRERTALDGLRAIGTDLQRCDFYDERELDGFIESVRERYASLRAVIHNASDWLAEGGDVAHRDVMWRMMQVHASAPYQINLAMADLLQACPAPHADIIHLGDYVSARGSRKHVAYAASKAAQDNLTLSFAARLAPKVKVNSIAPALILFNEHDSEDYRDQARRKNLLRREGGLEELQRAVDYLLESGYVTGRTLHMDGGRHVA
jgi:dihydromonapterin reductase/dihydrofolate reductase